MEILRLLSQWLNKKFNFRTPEAQTIFRLAAVQVLIGVGVGFWRPSIWPEVLVLCGLSFLATVVVMGYRPLRRVLTVKIDEKSVAPTLQIANETLPFLRRGLNEETASQTAEIIQKISDVAAVAITDRKKYWSFWVPVVRITRWGGPL